MKTHDEIFDALNEEAARWGIEIAQSRLSKIARILVEQGLEYCDRDIMTAFVGYAVGVGKLS